MTEPPSSRSPESYERLAAPALRASWMLRSTAVTSALAAVVGLLLVPGVRGTYASGVVDTVERVGVFGSYAMAVLLTTALVSGAYELARSERLNLGFRVVAVAAAVVVLGVCVPANALRMPGVLLVLLAIAASSVAAGAGIVALRAAHTRAVSIVLLTFVLAALLRVGAWHVAVYAGARAHTGLYDLSRGVASAAVLLEAGGQMVAAAWIGTRHRWAGQVASGVAVAAAFFVVWAAARGAQAGAAPWQVMLASSLADAPGTPPPAGMGAIATFLYVAAMFLSLAAAVVPAPLGAVSSALALALLSRGTFDVPLRALAATTAALWVAVATVDERAMWRALAAGTAKRPSAPPARGACARPSEAPPDVS
jgi:hypothetical protein